LATALGRTAVLRADDRFARAQLPELFLPSFAGGLRCFVRTRPFARARRSLAIRSARDTIARLRTSSPREWIASAVGTSRGVPIAPRIGPPAEPVRNAAAGTVPLGGSIVVAPEPLAAPLHQRVGGIRTPRWRAANDVLVPCAIVQLRQPEPRRGPSVAGTLSAGLPVPLGLEAGPVTLQVAKRIGTPLKLLPHRFAHAHEIPLAIRLANKVVKSRAQRRHPPNVIVRTAPFGFCPCVNRPMVRMLVVEIVPAVNAVQERLVARSLIAIEGIQGIVSP
jgi:hypothetical protein